jgi:S-DNA-T family DNA segregation ATPase FtsK/SpoIIIE
MATLANNNTGWTQEQLVTIAAFTKKLIGLGIEAQILRLEQGPIVTGYYFKLANSVPIAKILNKAEDFALAAGAEKVDIQRLGGEIAIFVKNAIPQYIEFKDYMHWYCSDPALDKMVLAIPVGVDTLGNKFAFDLVEQPHILLAGATGSGKSVFEAAILNSLAVRKSPAELQIYLVDTKQLDLPLFSKLQHVQEVITNLETFHDLMNKLLLTHQNRTNIIGGASCRNILEYNKLVGNSKQRLRHILLLIDEFGDLLMADREAHKDKKSDIGKLPTVEFWLQRLVQVSRATGIHVIAGTQRTSVKVINGDIKANFPCRISLFLPTEADSRTILGTGGAENLLGKGDMLIQYPSSEQLKRYHGPFVHTNDIANIIEQNEFIRNQYQSMRGEVLA